MRYHCYWMVSCCKVKNTQFAAACISKKLCNLLLVVACHRQSCLHIQSTAPFQKHQHVIIAEAKSESDQNVQQKQLAACRTMTTMSPVLQYVDNSATGSARHLITAGSCLPIVSSGNLRHTVCLCVCHVLSKCHPASLWINQCRSILSSNG